MPVACSLRVAGGAREPCPMTNQRPQDDHIESREEQGQRRGERGELEEEDDRDDIDVEHPCSTRSNEHADHDRAGRQASRARSSGPDAPPSPPMVASVPMSEVRPPTIRIAAANSSTAGRAGSVGAGSLELSATSPGASGMVSAPWNRRSGIGRMPPRWEPVDRHDDRMVRLVRVAAIREPCSGCPLGLDIRQPGPYSP